MTRPRRPPSLGLLTLAVYLFLYAPLLVLVVFSFNAGRISGAWQGFTWEWYARLLANPQVLSSLRNSLLIAFLTTAVCTVLGTAAALAFHRWQPRRPGPLEALLLLPMVVPEIVLATSLLLFFAAAGLRLGLLTVVMAHVSFSLSYAVIEVRARSLPRARR